MTLIDDAVLQRMAANPDAVQRFGFLRPTPTAPVRGCCGKAAAAPRLTLDLLRVRQQLIALPLAEQRQFLAMAGLDTGRVVYRQGGQLVDAQIG